MSEVKVNKLSPRNGTTVTIGDSGDTINIVGTLQNNGAAIPGDISSVVAGTGLSGGGTSGDVTINIEAAQPTITSLGTITTFRSTGIDDNADALAMTIDSSEQVGIGETVPLGKLHVKSADSGASVNSGHNQVIAENSGNSGMTILSGNTSNGAICFGDDGNNCIGYVNYDHSNNKIDFGTAGATQWAIDSSGNFLPAATDHGIYLGVTSAAAGNLLDDYEEGTWSPAITTDGGGGNSGVTYGDRYGTYTKIGRIVTVHVFCNLDAVSSFGTGNAIISTLPFSSNSASQYRSGVVIGYAKNWDNAPSGGTISTNANTIYLRKRNGTSALSNFTDIVQVGDMNTNSEIILTATYETA
jgi:hypothetical protein